MYQDTPMSASEREIALKNLSGSPSLTLHKGESLYELVQIAYADSNYTDAQLKAYTMSLGTRNQLKKPFIKVDEDKCIDNFLPIDG